MTNLELSKVTLEKIVGGGQTLGVLNDGKKVFVWGGLPDEEVLIRLVKARRSYAEGIVSEVIKSSPNRTSPADPDSYLSTSPWQIYSFTYEQELKSQLIDEAFLLHHVELPSGSELRTDKTEYGYRNKVEFSFWWNNDTNQLDLAFFIRGGKGKLPVTGTSLAMPQINEAARAIVDILRSSNIEARTLKTLLIRCDQNNNVSAQLYIKDHSAFEKLPIKQLQDLGLYGFEVIHSDHRSPASVVTERLFTAGSPILSDIIAGTNFQYATEGFFQINLPVYEIALREMRQWLLPNLPVVDMYSGVGTIGLSISDQPTTLVESNNFCIQEMRRNVALLKKDATVVHETAEGSLDYIKEDSLLIVDPPRAGLHDKVVEKINEAKPPRVIYLSCNPVTQARDVANLLDNYNIVHNSGYNFFPKTPHIEHLVVLDRK